MNLLSGILNNSMPTDVYVHAITLRVVETCDQRNLERLSKYADISVFNFKVYAANYRPNAETELGNKIATLGTAQLLSKSGVVYEQPENKDLK
jgi:hypothetical protein